MGKFLMASWYRHDIAAWMDGTEGLGDAEYRVYHIVCQLIYLNEGPIRVNEKGIAGRCNMHVLTFRPVLRKLVVTGMLKMTDDRLSNPRASTELKRLKSKSNPTQTSTVPPVDPDRTSTGPDDNGGEGLENKPLENKEAASIASPQTRLDKTRQESSVPNGTGADAPVIDEKTRLYRRAKEVLGKNSGGVVTKLLKAYDNNVRRALSVVEAANASADPAEYIGGAMRNATVRTRELTESGYTRPLV